MEVGTRWKKRSCENTVALLLVLEAMTEKNDPWHSQIFGKNRVFDKFYCTGTRQNNHDTLHDLRPLAVYRSSSFFEQHPIHNNIDSSTALRVFDKVYGTGTGTGQNNHDALHDLRLLAV